MTTYTLTLEPSNLEAPIVLDIPCTVPNIGTLNTRHTNYGVGTDKFENITKFLDFLADHNPRFKNMFTETRNFFQLREGGAPEYTATCTAYAVSAGDDVETEEITEAKIAEALQNNEGIIFVLNCTNKSSDSMASDVWYDAVRCVAVPAN